MRQNNIFGFLSKSLLSGLMFGIGLLITILGVYAFESLSTTPGNSGNQSLGSQILSKLSSGGFDRTTDSMEALSEKLDTIISQTGGSSGGFFTKCQVKRISTPTYPTCPTGYTDIHNYTSARIAGGAGIVNATMTDSTRSTTEGMYGCTVCEKD